MCSTIPYREGHAPHFARWRGLRVAKPADTGADALPCYSDRYGHPAHQLIGFVRL